MNFTADVLEKNENINERNKKVLKGPGLIRSDMGCSIPVFMIVNKKIALS